MDYMRSLFGEFCSDADEVELRATILAALFIANNLTTVGHGRQSRTEVLNRALNRLLA
jgi:hypothetical protein